jgi:hypothetical protein
MEHTRNVLYKWVDLLVEQKNRILEHAIRKIMQHRFGILDDERIKDFASTHKLACCYDEDFNFIGISVNNRWLYTATGQVIGKKGKRWMIEKINYGNTNKGRL